MEFKESEKVELKSIVTEDLKKEIVAFLNSDGGEIYIGINDDGSLLGVNDYDFECLKISNMVHDSISPDSSMFIHYSSLIIDDKEVIKISINKGTKCPYYISSKGLTPSGVYIRNGNSSSPSSENYIKKLIIEKENYNFENTISINQDLTFQETKNEFLKVGLSFSDVDKKTLFIKNRNGQFSSLGYILSDQSEYKIKCASFKDDKITTFNDRKEFTGSCFKLLSDVYNYISIHNELHSTFSGLYRLDTSSYPEEALRECLINAIIHRDYSLGTNAAILVKIYPEKIEFLSPGGLVYPMTKNDIFSGYSYLRNPYLTSIFYRLTIVEAYGTGIKKICSSYDTFYNKPKFEVTDNVFKVTLYNRNYDDVVSFSDSSKNSTLSLREREVMSLFQSKKIVNRKDVESLLSLSGTTSNRILKKLESEGLITLDSKGRTTSYRKVDT